LLDNVHVYQFDNIDHQESRKSTSTYQSTITSAVMKADEVTISQTVWNQPEAISIWIDMISVGSS